ncbi:MAG: vWA domain-containing protein [Pseudomonadota bacterium]
MLIEFLFALRAARLPVSLHEYLTLLEGLRQHLAWGSVDEFYYLARATLVKDEAQIDRFDRVFGEYFRGAVAGDAPGVATLPEEWLRREAERLFSDEERRLVQSLGGWDALMETLRRRLEEQKGRHQGGSKWIGTAGSSPFGAWGYNPEGVRIGQAESRQRRAVKVWDQREFRNFDDRVELGTRNIKVALRRLRRFAREGAATELDLEGTIGSTARNAGWLDLRMVPERHNAVKVLLFLDVGGSMDDHVRVVEELFSAARSEFRHLEQFYFHNCIYESVWRDNRRRFDEREPLTRVLHRFPHDYRLVIVGDATMSPYEITHPGGSVEHNNDEPGAAWLQRLLDVYGRAVWINPQPEARWSYHESIGIVRQLMGDRMVPLTLEGLERAMRSLAR